MIHNVTGEGDVERLFSADRREVKPHSHTPSRDSQRGHTSVEGRPRSRDEPSECYRCKGFGHFAKDYQMGTTE